MPEWAFLAEGGQHIVYTNGSRILRVDKKRGSPSAIAHCLCQRLAPYTDVPIAHTIKGRDLGTTPPMNHASKTLDETTFELDDNIVGYFLPDYRFSLRDASSSICLEIKPKAGYTAISPLVAEDRQVKFTKTRFEIQQRLYATRALEKRWMKADRGYVRSSYNPLDLFSGERARIQQALSAMVQSPQNNLKIWRDGDCCAVSVEDGGLKEGLMVPPFGSNGLSLLEVVAVILQSEPFLEQVLQLQRLDVIDGDGAIILYERLVNTFCNGNAEAAENMIDNVQWRNGLNGAATLHELLQHAPFASNGANQHEISRYCELANSVENHLCSCEGQPHGDMVRETRQEALRLLSDFSAQDCCFLVQCWLLSLAMCDLTFFITLRLVHSDAFSQASLQSSEKPGQIYYKDRSFEYELKCIDYDLKPAKKLRSRKLKESLITDQLFPS